MSDAVVARQGLASGRIVSQLAERSGYSERAMFRLLRKVYVRMQVRNRTEALLRARQQGWLQRELVVMAILGLPGGVPARQVWRTGQGVHGPSAIPDTGSAAGTGPVTVVTSMALLTGEDHQGLATASTLRWGVLLSEPRRCLAAAG